MASSCRSNDEAGPLKISIELMARLKNLGRRVLFRSPLSEASPDYWAGRIVNYDPDTERATIVATAPGGWDCTYSSVPYDTNLEFQKPAGSWCYFDDLEVIEENQALPEVGKPETKPQEAKAVGSS